MDRKKPPFQPVIGNPEAHDYLDWYRHLLRIGQIKSTPAGKDGTASPNAANEKPIANGDNPRSARDERS